MEGDDAMVLFCHAVRPVLVGAMALYTGQPELAEELAQETLLRVCGDWPRVRRMEHPEAWAHRVALNLAHSWFRRRRIEARLARRRSEDVEAVATDLAAAVVVRDAVAALPTRQRQAVVLRYFADLPVEQTAAAMGCAAGTVKALTHQGIGTLRTALALEESDNG